MSTETTCTTKIKPLLATAVLVLLAQPAYGETTIGRWCDRMIPNMPKYNHTMAIVVADDGKVVLKSKFGDGSSKTSELREPAGGIYEEIGSASGDKYRIIPSTGNLQLLDEDGLIRVATRLENAPQSGECSK
ncbi:MAG: hypothetical protein ACE5H0_12735 [Bacteroidota bacterium]